MHIIVIVFVYLHILGKKAATKYSFNLRIQSPPESYIGKTSLLERQPFQGPPHSLYNEQKAGVPQSEPSESRTTSMLHEQLRYSSDTCL